MSHEYEQSARSHDYSINTYIIIIIGNFAIFNGIISECVFECHFLFVFLGDCTTKIKNKNSLINS